MEYSYTQPQKNKVRHFVIRHAVELLTTMRSEACCVRNSYVRDVYKYFLNKVESHECKEAEKIDPSYIREWEKLQLNAIGMKRAEELSVCYLAGPEPINDFKEFTEMGVLPENIWAFEIKKSVYSQALASLQLNEFKQPKIIKTSIENFFENTPRKFDIVYIDACASLISDQHALRSVAALFQYHRLNSPGILITNFAGLDHSNQSEIQEYVDAIARYDICRNGQTCFAQDNPIQSEFYRKKKISLDTNDSLDYKYGNFVTQMVCNAASISIPILRFVNSPYVGILINKPIQEEIENSNANGLTGAYIRGIKYNTFTRFFLENSFIMEKMPNQFLGINKVNKLMNELSGKNSFHYKIPECLKFLYNLKQNKIELREEVSRALDFYSGSKCMYQFLDKTNENLFFDTVINQLAYPMHYVAGQSRRYIYIAKSQRMFTDLILFDECRYIYDWMPSVNQLRQAFSNLSWQYTFRFGLDGLVKQRINYNNEFFFQGSVISKNIDGFKAAHFPERQWIE